jgi:hypothetical protein
MFGTKRSIILMAICLLAVTLFAPRVDLAVPPPQQFTLTTAVVGSGSAAPAGGTYNKGTRVSMTATPDPGWEFDHWEGDLSGSENPKTVRMTSNKHVIAVFIEEGPPPTYSVDRAGLRASPYGIDPFPGASWWIDSTTDMASRFQDASPAVLWLVGEIMFPVSCRLSFPNPNPGATYPDVLFMETDEYEAHFTAFDQAGVKVWLSVEPGNADVVTLINLTLAHYGHHSCIAGFAVDGEWYQKKGNHNGKAITDAEAQTWSELVRSYNPNYLLVTKHWLIEKMPPTYRTGMVFVDDSQGFGSLEAMVNEFTAWGQAFAPAAVGFQYGYSGDKRWWKNLSDPPGDIGIAILTNVPNTTDLFWVDFTADEIWPIQ